MKRILVCVTIVATLSHVMLLVASCKKEDDPSAAETVLNQLTAHNWRLAKVSVDGTDATALFAGLELQWNRNKTFGATHGGAIWPSSGTWSFTDESGKTLLLSLNDADVQVTIETLNDATLVISLHWDKTSLGTGKVSSISGEHVFEFEAI